jgi:hypothetical protein
MHGLVLVLMTDVMPALTLACSPVTDCVCSVGHGKYITSKLS